jgi:hypothetical protein
MSPLHPYYWATTIKLNCNAATSCLPVAGLASLFSVLRLGTPFRYQLASATKFKCYRLLFVVETALRIHADDSKSVQTICESDPTQLGFPPINRLGSRMVFLFNTRLRRLHSRHGCD